MNILFEGSNLLGKVIFFIVGFACVASICTFSHAQVSFGLDPTGRSGDEPPPLLEERPSPTLPPPQILPTLPPLPERKAVHLPLRKVFISEIKVAGATVFLTEELDEVTAPYVNRELAAEDLEELRRSLTLYYVNKGYVNSGAIIPDQTVADGVIEFRIIEGELTDIEVEGTKWFRAGYIKDRLALGAGPPLNIIPLQQRLQIMQQDPRIERVNAELKPGVKPGESFLNLWIEEKIPYNAWLRFNNYQSPTVGAERGQVIIEHRNLTGHGDILSLDYGRSDGIDPQIDVSYSFPFTARDTTLTLQYRRNDFNVVEEPFEPLDVESESEIFSVTLRHPFYRTINQEFALTLSGEYLDNETYLLGEKFSFSPGAREGKSTVTALRFSQEWTYRAPAQVVAVRSRFSLGLDALGSTTNHSDIPDSQFFSWMGQFQWARRFKFRDMQMIFRTDVQLANDPLLPLEQIAVGGRYSVRGYRENQMVRDNGLITSLELRIPLIYDKPWADSIQIAPFVDFGRAWNKDISTPDPKNITSIGLGLRWAATLPPPLQLKTQLEIYWGYPFRDIETSRWDLQDEGLHLQLTVAAF